MKKIIKNMILVIFVCCLGLMKSGAVNAGVTEIQQLQWGEFIVKNNNAVHTITVTTNGGYSFDGAGFIEISPPQEGIYDLDGMVGMAGAPVVSVTATALTPLAGSGNNLTMTNFTTTHSATVSGAGVVRVNLGGEARTNGNMVNYLDQTYTGQIELQVNF